MWERILVPLDFSPCAERAVRVAADLARAHGAKLLLLHVSDIPPNVPPEALVTPPGAELAVRVDDYTAFGADQRLEAFAAPLRLDGISVQIATRAGDVVSEVLAEAKAFGAHVMVVGTHGRRGLSHLLLGSVAEKLVREASVPVVTVRSTAPEAEPTLEESLVEDELAG
jgi:nucleotide-binding universal stress UspA family protein